MPEPTLTCKGLLHKLFYTPHKDAFKQFARENEVPTPLAVSFSNEEEAMGKICEFSYPVMVKPIDLTGGKGCTKVVSESDCAQAIHYAFERSPHKKIVVEPFVDGSQHSFSTFLVDQKVAAYYSDNEYCEFNPFLVSTSGGPATQEDQVRGILISEAEKIASKLELVNGVFHYQYILGRDHKPHILEITRRCSGDLYPVPVEHATGIPWAEWIVRSECGLSCDAFPWNARQKCWGGRHCVMGDKAGVVKSVQIADELEKNIYDSFYWGGKGTKIENPLVDKIGILFLEYGSEEEMLYKSEHIAELVKIIYE